MCHITLRWEQCSLNLRRDIERELDKALMLAAPEENPAAGWFLTIAGLVFGVLLVITLAFSVFVVVREGLIG